MCNYKGCTLPMLLRMLSYLNSYTPAEAINWYNNWELSFFKDFIYLFLERGERRERNIQYVVGCLLHTPNLGPCPQPRHVP